MIFASRKRHTRCALVTGVQTCALPISATTAWPSTCEREASLRPIRPVPPKIAIYIMLRSVLQLREVQPSWATAMRQDRDRPYILNYPLSFAGICDIAAGFVLCAGKIGRAHV